MVIARTKLMIDDDLLRPWHRVQINYSGPNPHKFYTEIPNLLAKVFRVHVGDVQEKKFSWMKGDPEKFNIEWELNKDLDKFSYYIIRIKLKGAITKGVGNASMTIDSALRTEYPQETIWERSLFYEFMRMTWHTAFYERRREEFIREGRRLLGVFIEDVKRLTHQGD